MVLGGRDCAQSSYRIEKKPTTKQEQQKTNNTSSGRLMGKQSKSVFWDFEDEIKILASLLDCKELWKNRILKRTCSSMFIFHSTQRGCTMFFLFLPCCSGTDSHFCNSSRLLLVASVLTWREEIAMSLPRWSEDRITIMWEIFVVTGVALYFLKANHNIYTLFLRLFLESTDLTVC